MSRWLPAMAVLLACAQSPALAAPCEAWYPFDGNLNDASGNGYAGLTIPAADAPAPQFVEGRNGQALRLTGGTAMRSFLDLHYDFCPQVTITGWFRLPSFAASGNQYVFSTGSGIGPGLYVSGGTLRIEATGNGMTYRDAVRSGDTWHFFAVSYDYGAGTYTLTWRDRTVSEDMGPLSYSVEDAFWVGTFNDRMSYTAGDLLIDDLRVHGSVLSADEIRALATAATTTTTSPNPVGTTLLQPIPEALAPALPGSATEFLACETHQDCTAGSYCAWDDTCHPDRHAPKQALTFAPVQMDVASNIILPDVSSVEEDTGQTADAAASGPYGAGDPSFTRVAGIEGGNQRRLDLGEEFLTSIRMHRPAANQGSCRIHANDTVLDLCHDAPENGPQTIAVELTDSLIGRLSVCAPGVSGLQVWGNVVGDDGSIRYEPSSSQDQFPACSQFEQTFSNAWGASMLCASNQLATGIVVHSNDVGPFEAITGLQLICRRVAVR